MVMQQCGARYAANSSDVDTTLFSSNATSHITLLIATSALLMVEHCGSTNRGLKHVMPPSGNCVKQLSGLSRHIVPTRLLLLSWCGVRRQFAPSTILMRLSRSPGSAQAK